MSTDTLPVRHAARVVLLDNRQRTLLMRYDEDGRRFWALPGGTLEPGESHEGAAQRELAEEIGVHDVPIGAQIAARDTGQSANRRVVEKYFTASVDSADVEAGSPTQPDQIRGHRWWTLDELRNTEEIVYPAALSGLISMLITAGVPAEPVQLTA